MNNVAILMSVYKNDRLPFVKMSVESILEQTFSLFDFYIIADGLLKEEVDKYLSELNDNRVFLFRNEENKGLARSLNKLLQIVLPKGYEFIARMDADDISLPDRLKTQVTFLEANDEVDCVGTFAIEIDEQGEVFYKKEMPVEHHACHELFKKRDCLIHPTVMFRQKYFEKAGLYPEDTYFAEDTMMWANGFANGCRFANIPEYLFKFRLDKIFFKRRRGWKHAVAIYNLRRKVNKKLHYPISANMYAIMYAIAKMMPTPILNLIYKTSR